MARGPERKAILPVVNRQQGTTRSVIGAGRQTPSVLRSRNVDTSTTVLFVLCTDSYETIITCRRRRSVCRPFSRHLIIVVGKLGQC